MFWSRVRRGCACWLWIGTRHKRGYGVFTVGRRQYYAHRIAFVISGNPDPAGKLVCHSCDNPLCVRPSHLWAGSDADNHDDCVRKGRNVRGKSVWTARLCPEDVIAIRRLYRSGGFLQRELARRFGVSNVAVGAVLRRQTWKWVVPLG